MKLTPQGISSPSNRNSTPNAIEIIEDKVHFILFYSGTDKKSIKWLRSY
jgi:hypothetical protein